MLQIKEHTRYNFITFARMKQWLMILALCWAAATVNAAGESQSRTLRAEITAAVLSQADSERFETNNAPLLATACTSCTQLSGAEQGAGRSVRHAGNFIVAATRGYACAGIRIRPHRLSENAAYARPAYAGPIGIFII